MKNPSPQIRILVTILKTLRQRKCIFLQANSLLTQTAAQGLRCFLGGQIPRICHPVHSDLDCRLVSKKYFQTIFLGQEHLVL